jgi:hypothetical protein
VRKQSIEGGFRLLEGWEATSGRKLGSSESGTQVENLALSVRSNGK